MLYRDINNTRYISYVKSVVGNYVNGVYVNGKERISIKQGCNDLNMKLLIEYKETAEEMKICSIACEVFSVAMFRCSDGYSSYTNAVIKMSRECLARLIHMHDVIGALKKYLIEDKRMFRLHADNIAFNKSRIVYIKEFLNKFPYSIGAGTFIDSIISIRGCSLDSDIKSRYCDFVVPKSKNVVATDTLFRLYKELSDGYIEDLVKEGSSRGIDIMGDLTKGLLSKTNEDKESREKINAQNREDRLNKKTEETVEAIEKHNIIVNHNIQNYMDGLRGENRMLVSSGISLTKSKLVNSRKGELFYIAVTIYTKKVKYLEYDSETKEFKATFDLNHAKLFDDCVVANMALDKLKESNKEIKWASKDFRTADRLYFSVQKLFL